MIFLSLKTYKEATGDKAVSLCQTIKKVIKNTQIPIIPAVQPFDLYRIKKEVDIEVWTQHLDPIDPDRYFGWLSPYSAKQAGASGVIINHGEHEIPFDQIKKTVTKCQEYDLKTLIICDTIDLVKQVIPLKPNFLAYERKDLIGGDIPMIEAEKESIKKVIKLSPLPVIIGAGIKTEGHVKETLAVGGAGVILASAVIKSQNPESVLLNLASAFQHHTSKV
ncbi:MAG: triose-phosphate isomerase [Candidatus Beckwithbacteria bacterium]|nr:triose-phosphate isomerase [Patescibacteria group bacterium]